MKPNGQQLIVILAMLVLHKQVQGRHFSLITWAWETGPKIFAVCVCVCVYIYIYIYIYILALFEINCCLVI